MRVRITKALAGSIDGIQLSRLSKGRVYDVNTSLACYLLSEEMAEPAASDAQEAVVPVALVPRSIAADRAHKHPKTSRKKKEH